MAALYSAYGLTIASDLPCPELCSGAGSPEVTIRLGEVPQALANPAVKCILWEAERERSLLKLDRPAGARFLVQHGREIIIQRTRGDSDDAVRLFLLGSCMVSLLHQRGVLPLHANVLATRRGAVAIAGASGAGKSTLSLELLRRGYQLLSDDIGAVTMHGRQPLMVQPGIPRLKLWADALEHLGETGTFRRVRPDLEKYDLPLKRAYCDQPLPLVAVYVLQPSNEDLATLTPVTGMQKMRLLRQQHHADEYQKAIGASNLWFPYFGAIADGVRVATVQRPSRGFRVAEVANLVEGDFAA